jgi:hypothetical protein
MQGMLDTALQPYLDGDLDATDALIDALFEVIATADRSSALISTLYTAIKGLTPSHELMAPMFKAIGAAYEFTAPAPAHTGSQAVSPSQAAARNRRGGPKDGSLGEEIVNLMTARPGVAWKPGTLAKQLGGVQRTGAVGAALNGLVRDGLAILAIESPKHYMLTDDPAAPTQTPDTTPDEAEDAPANAPAADTAPNAAAEPADTGKAPAARRGTAKK